MITDERLKEIAIDIPDRMSLADAKKLFVGLVKYLTIGELVEMATELLSSRHNEWSKQSIIAVLQRDNDRLRQTIKRLVEDGENLAFFSQHDIDCPRSYHPHGDEGCTCNCDYALTQHTALMQEVKK